MTSYKPRSPISVLNLLLSCLNFILFILSAASIAPIILIKMPPTLRGLAFLMASCISLLSSFVGFYSQLTDFCFITHISLLIASYIGQVVCILALVTREKSNLSMLKSPRDPEESKLLVRVECGIFMAMAVMQLLVMTCTMNKYCLVREYEPLEAERKSANSQEKEQNDSKSARGIHGKCG